MRIYVRPENCITEDFCTLKLHLKHYKVNPLQWSQFPHPPAKKCKEKFRKTLKLGQQRSLRKKKSPFFFCISTPVSCISAAPKSNISLPPYFRYPSSRCILHLYVYWSSCQCYTWRNSRHKCTLLSQPSALQRENEIRTPEFKIVL